MPDRLPVLIIINGLGNGGAEQHLLRVLPEIDASRFEITLFALHGGGSLEQAFIERAVRLIQGQGRLSALFSLASEIRRNKPLVHCFLPEAYLFAGTLAALLGAPCKVMSRRSRNFYQQRHPLAAWVERRLHGRMNALLGNSKAVVADLLLEGAAPDRVRLIYNGIDADVFPKGEERQQRRAAVRLSLGVAEDTIVIVCVANLFPYKGHADLLAALASLRNRFVGRYQLWLVGRDAGEQVTLEQEVSRLGLAECVRFLGERQDVPDLLAAGDIGVLASHEEGFSNAVLEGMAASLPMVVTDVGGNAEAVLDGECGFVVPAKSPVELGEALGKLIDDVSLRQKMGEAGRVRVVESFSIKACVSAYEAFYEEIWEKSRKKPEGQIKCAG